MSDRRSVLPASCLPRGMSRPQAAEYVGTDVAMFDAMVASGRMPPPKIDEGDTIVWDRNSLDDALHGERWPPRPPKPTAEEVDRRKRPWAYLPRPDQSKNWPTVYFVKYPGRLIKIGTSAWIPGRVGELQAAIPQEISVVGVMCGGPEMEQRLHKEFADLRVRGEWFKATKRLRDFIREFASFEHPWINEAL